MNKLSAKFDRNRAFRTSLSVDAPADSIASLEHSHFMTRTTQIARCRKSGRAGANDDCRATPASLPPPERLFLYPAEQPALVTAGTAERLFWR